MSALHVGSYVEQREDGAVCVGCVMDVNPQSWGSRRRVYVRWHKGYATWEDVTSLRKIRRPNP